MRLTIREMEAEDIPLMVDYFINADEAYLKGMGADKSKLPSREDWIALLEEDLTKPNDKKSFYYIIWLFDHQPIGHTNINKIKYGEEAFMHLHIWKADDRKLGLGTQYLFLSIPKFFQNFKLKKLLCEPHADNPAPNKTLTKLGFQFIKTYETTPGWINFHQPVSRYELVKKF